VIWGKPEEEYFRRRDWTDRLRDLPVGQHKQLWW
jgi:hypothetical protein